MTRQWIGEERAPELVWGGQTWTLRLDSRQPGLHSAGCPLGPLLALDGLAALGRWDPDALTGDTLVASERRHGRIEATYQPAGSGGIVVRAAWSAWEADGVDLEVQVHAYSVGELKAVEVKVRSQFPEPVAAGDSAQAGQAPPHPRTVLRWVEPRDARAAALSYDGREPELRGLTTLPPREEAFLSPRLVPSPLGDGWLYAEMVHPDDVSRRIREGGRTLAQAHTTHYALFGHDLERGVVLRARLRALWLRGDDAKRTALDRFDEFVRARPPLTA